MGRLSCYRTSKDYWIMDGRAEFDIDSAVVLEAFTAKDDKLALQYLECNYPDIDAVLVHDGEVVRRPI